MKIFGYFLTTFSANSLVIRALAAAAVAPANSPGATKNSSTLERSSPAYPRCRRCSCGSGGRRRAGCGLWPASSRCASGERPRLPTDRRLGCPQSPRRNLLEDDFAGLDTLREAEAIIAVGPETVECVRTCSHVRLNLANAFFLILWAGARF